MVSLQLDFWWTAEVDWEYVLESADSSPHLAKRAGRKKKVKLIRKCDWPDQIQSAAFGTTPLK